MKSVPFLLLAVFFWVSYTEATYAQTPRDAYIAGQAHYQSTMMQQILKEQKALQKEKMQTQPDVQIQTPEMPICGPGPVEGIPNIKPR